MKEVIVSEKEYGEKRNGYDLATALRGTPGRLDEREVRGDGRVAAGRWRAKQDSETRWARDLELSSTHQTTQRLLLCRNQ